MSNTTAASLMMLLLGVCSVMAFQPHADAKPALRPRIFRDLPPASPSDVPPVTEGEQFTQPSPGDLDDSRELDFQAPNRPNTYRSNSRRFRVDIKGDSPLLLAQVKKLEPEAFVRSREGVIQAGSYSDRYYAEQRIRELATLGIIAEITASSDANFYSDIPQTPQVTTREAQNTDIPQLYSEPPRIYRDNPTVQTDNPRLYSDSRRLVSPRNYFVVVPASRGDLADMAAEVIRTGVNRDAVQTREGPRGSHVAVGPFEARREAERWSSYLRSRGIDARVYYGR